ncbi:MAG: GNAT family protein [Ginsengibacter sp.]
MKNNLSVREIRESDISLIIDYWYDADDEFLYGLGVDINKIPSKEKWQNMFMEQISKPYQNKKSYCIIWEADGIPIGHSNVNKILFGQEAYMHLHIWKKEFRKIGYGARLVKMTLPLFFENLKLKNLYCEPYALNPSPNETLKSIGFEFINEYVTIPGFLNFEQKVNLWKLSHKKLKTIS